MKKKIKLEAWRFGFGKVEFYEVGSICPTVASARLPKFDIEKEIEVPDEVVKPIERWVNIYKSIHYTHETKQEAEKSADATILRIAHLVEILPGQVVIDREILAKAWDDHMVKRDYDRSHKSEGFKIITRALGLGDA
jgi:hypothetical protein